MTLAVFFPSLMGFGILVSGALLVADVVHKLLPHRGRRRRYRVAVGAYGLVARTAEAAGRDLEPPAFLTRDFRSRWSYLGAAVLLGGGSAAAAWSGLAAHADPLGVFYRSPWAFGLGVGFGIGLALLSLIALTLAVGHRSLPRAVHRLVAASSLGRVQLPEPQTVSLGSVHSPIRRGGST